MEKLPSKSHISFRLQDKTRVVKMTGVQNRTWEYTGDKLKNTEKIIVQWKYHFPGKDVLAKWERPRRTGFNIAWYVLDEKGQQKEIVTSGEEKWTSNFDLKA